eukprot:scaffold1804_cov263-Pinguiococcus_pyrenoidosus.AAC.34
MSRGGLGGDAGLDLCPQGVIQGHAGLHLEEGDDLDIRRPILKPHGPPNHDAVFDFCHEVFLYDCIDVRSADSHP